jgi:hypothetical protein
MFKICTLYTSIDMTSEEELSIKKKKNGVRYVQLSTIERTR